MWNLYYVAFNKLMSIYTSTIPSILTPSSSASRYQPYGYISFGTPPQNFKILLDTGSSAPFISESGCKYTGGSKGNQPKGPCLTALFDPSKSSTFAQDSSKFKYSFGSDKYVGKIGKDTLSVGNFVFPNFPMGLPTKVTLGLGELDFDGIIGLGANDGSEPIAFVDAMKKSNLASQQFSFYFPQSDITQEGQFMIGGSNQKLYTGNIQWLEVPDQYWDVPSFTISVGGKVVNNVPFSADNTYIDTGTDILMGPTNEITMLCAAIGTKFDPNTGYCQIPCAELSTVKNLEISFLNTNVVLLINVQNYFSFPNTVNSTMCDLAIQNGGTAGNWGIGLSVIRQFYTVWDVSTTKYRVGFATPVESMVESMGEESMPMLPLKHHHHHDHTNYLSSWSLMALVIPIWIMKLFRR